MSRVNQHCHAFGFHHVDNTYILFHLTMCSRTSVMVICADKSENCSTCIFMLMLYVIFGMIKNDTILCNGVQDTAQIADTVAMKLHYDVINVLPNSTTLNPSPRYICMKTIALLLEAFL